MMRQNDRRADFKKTLDQSEGRRRREETTRQIRKEKKEENLRKRRQGVDSQQNVEIASSCSGRPSQRNFSTVQDIPEMKRILLSPHSSQEEILEATRGFRRILSVESSPPVQEVLDAGVLGIFIHNLTANLTASDLIFESAWALTNIASTSETATVVEAGAVPSLIQLLQYHQADVRDQASWCLGNIAGDNVEFRDILLNQGILPPLLLNMNQPANMSLLGNVTWTVANLCRGKPSPSIASVSPAMQPLADLLTHDVSIDVLLDAVWGLSYLSDGDEYNIGRVMKTGVVSKLMEFMENKSSPLLTPTIRCLGNFVTGNDEQTQAVIDAGILKHLSSLLESPKKAIRKESCWLASNIAAGTQKQISLLLSQSGIMQNLIDNAIQGSWDIKKEALWALSNICTIGTDIHIQALIQSEGLRPLAEALSLTNADTGVLLACLDAVERVMEVGERNGHDYCRIFDEYNGIDYLENLQEHPSDDVYKKTVKIIEAYFGGDDEEDENLAPAMTDSGTFGFGIASSSKELFPVDVSSNPAPMGFQFGMSNRAF